MKKLYFVLLFLAVFVQCSGATFTACGPTYDKALTDSTGIVADTNYTLNLSTGGDWYYNAGKAIDYFSCQAIVSSETYAGITGSTSTVNGTTDTIVSSVTYPTGYSLLYTSAAFSTAGLTNNTTYFAIAYSAGQIQLATTKALAIAGTVVNISTTPGTGTFTLTPVDIQASSPYSFKWQASNDNSNWFDLTATSVTVTSATAPTNRLWDFGFTTYKYIRCTLQSGAFGSLKLKLQGYGKRLIP